MSFHCEAQACMNLFAQCLFEEYNAFGDAGKNHLKAKKVKAEIDKVGLTVDTRNPT